MRKKKQELEGLALMLKIVSVLAILKLLELISLTLEIVIELIK